jgi:hypothetical protein
MSPPAICLSDYLEHAGEDTRATIHLVERRVRRDSGVRQKSTKGTVERSGDATASGGEQFDQLFEIRDNFVIVPHGHHRFSPLSEPGSYGAIP